MATFTVTTTQRIGEITGKAGGDIYNVNGGKLIVDQHSRFGKNQSNASATAATSLGSMTISATLGGEIVIDGTKVRMIPFSGGSGTIPALGTAITVGVASGELMCVYSAITAAPLIAGATMPATGFIQVNAWNGVEYSSGALIGLSATCSGASKVGYLEILGDDAGTITVPRLGTFSVTGAWYDVGVTSGVQGQSMQLPTNGVTTMQYHGAFIETAVGSGEFEFLPNVHTSAATQAAGTEAARRKVCGITQGGLLTLGSVNAVAGVGYTPASGLRVVIPNVCLFNCTAAARNTIAVANATLATRYDLTTTGGGVIALDKCHANWYLSAAQAFSFNLTDTSTACQISVSEIATPMLWQNVGVGHPYSNATLNAALSMKLCFAGAIFERCVFSRITQAASGAHTTILTDCEDVLFDRCVLRAELIRANATTYSMLTTRVADMQMLDCLLVQGAVSLAACRSVELKNTAYVDNVTGTTGTANGNYVVYLSSGCTDILIDAITLPVTNNQPYAGLVYVAVGGNSKIKIRNIGTQAAPLSLGSANQTGYVWYTATGAASADIYVQRVYCSNTRIGFSTHDNSCKNIYEANCAGDYADGSVLYAFNAERKACGWTPALTGQVSVYGVHWQDVFTSATLGRFILMMNEATTQTKDVIALSPSAKFTSSGGLYMPSAPAAIAGVQRAFLDGQSYQIAPTGGYGVTGGGTGGATVLPKKLMFYYGWLSGINNVYDPSPYVGQIAELAKADVVILGDGIQDSAHGDYAATAVIVPSIPSSTKAFGYIAMAWVQTASTAQIQARVDQWDALGVYGIFLDEYGYDYGVTRAKQNEIVAYMRTKGLIPFFNAWSPNDVFSDKNELGASGFPSPAQSGDYYLAENWFYAIGAFTLTNYVDIFSEYQAIAPAGIVLCNTATKQAGTTSVTDNESDAFIKSYMAAAMIGASYFQFTDENYGSDGFVYMHGAPTEANAITARQFVGSLSTPANTGGDWAEFTMPYYALGHTGFSSVAMVMGGGTVGNYSFDIRYDKNDGNGWSAWATGLSATTVATTLAGITGIDVTKGIKLALRIRTTTANATAITSVYITTTVTTASQQVLYPLDIIRLTIAGLQDGSDVIFLASGTTTELSDAQSVAGSTYDFLYSQSQLVDIGIFKEGFVPLYIRNYLLGSSDAIFPVSQTIDRNFS
jgi:hypothetical protein